MAPVGLKRGIFALSASAILLLFSLGYMEMFRMEAKQSSLQSHYDMRQANVRPANLGDEGSTMQVGSDCVYETVCRVIC